MKNSVGDISILLVDDHSIVIEGIEALISNAADMRISGKATSGAGALSFLEQYSADIMITDYSMDDMDGITLIAKARRVAPALRIIVLSMHDEAAVVQDVLRAGVDGYILKKYTHHELLTAIRIVHEGGQFWSPEINQMLLRRLQPETTGQITEREMEVLRLLTKELTSKQIAQTLFISERTVETHRKNLLRKTNATSTIGLIKYAYEHKLL